jgi:hypothetical protein
MPRGTRKSKCTFRGIVAPDPISASQLETAERILARFVALAYAGDNSDLFSPKASNRELAELPGCSGNTSGSIWPVFSCSDGIIRTNGPSGRSRRT